MRTFARSPLSCMLLAMAAGCPRYDSDATRGAGDAGSATDAGGVAECRSTSIELNAQDVYDLEPDRTTLCSLEPDGSVVLSYAITGAAVDNPYAVCVAGTHKDLEAFDADHQADGALEVAYCTDNPIPGGLNLWYGDPPNRKYLVLVGRGETMAAGCRVSYFTPEMARFATFFKDNDASSSQVPTCNQQCGRTPAECATPFANVPVALAGEWLLPGASADARVRLLSIHHVSSGCLCQSDQSCSGSRSTCRSGAFAPIACEVRAAPEGGVCVAGGAEKCGDLVGRYAGGARPGRSDAFEAAYARHYPHLGCPVDGGGGPYVHAVAGIDLQDYSQPDEALQLSQGGASALVYSATAGEAFLVFGDFWHAYACLRDAGLTAVGGASLLGAPASESHLEGDAIRQDFDLGYLTRGGSDGQTVVHLNTARTLEPDVTQGCGTQEPVAVSAP